MPAMIGRTERSSTSCPMRAVTKPARVSPASSMPAPPPIERSFRARRTPASPSTRTQSGASGRAGTPRNESRRKGRSSHPPRRAGAYRRAPEPAGSTEVSPRASTIEEVSVPRTTYVSAPRSTFTPPTVPRAMRPPRYPRASMRRGRMPARASSQAATRPAMPPPTTTAPGWVGMASGALIEHHPAREPARRCASGRRGRSWAARRARG